MNHLQVEVAFVRAKPSLCYLQAYRRCSNDERPSNRASKCNSKKRAVLNIASHIGALFSIVALCFQLQTIPQWSGDEVEQNYYSDEFILCARHQLWILQVPANINAIC